MNFFTDLLPIDMRSAAPIYLQLANAITQNIRNGRLRKGLKLPSSRELGTLLGINRLTVVAAYQELDAQGWIETRPRKGVFVTVNLPLLTPKSIDDEPVDNFPETPGFTFTTPRIMLPPPSVVRTEAKLIINDGFPDIRLAPINELIRSMRSSSRRSANKKYFMYGHAQGSLSLRQALAPFLSDTRGLPIQPENILITKGAQMGIYLAALAVIKPGDHVVVGTPGYNVAETTFQQLGAKVNYIPVDDFGIDVNAIARLCARKRIRAVYVIPHHHNPTTVTLTPERRMNLLALAHKHNFAIIEDDYDYDFHYASKPIMPMASHDRHGNVIYIGTMTKTLAPAIRIGFMVGPKSFIDVLTRLRKTIDTQGDSFIENALADLYKDGTIIRHIKKSVKLYKERRDNFCSLLNKEIGAKVLFRVPDGGMSVWVNFLGNDPVRIATRALERGLLIPDGRHFDRGKMKHNSVRCGFASLNMKEQEKAIRILAECFE